MGYRRQGGYGPYERPMKPSKTAGFATALGETVSSAAPVFGAMAAERARAMREERIAEMEAGLWDERWQNEVTQRNLEREDTQSHEKDLRKMDHEESGRIRKDQLDLAEIQSRVDVMKEKFRQEQETAKFALEDRKTKVEFARNLFNDLAKVASGGGDDLLGEGGGLEVEGRLSVTFGELEIAQEQYIAAALGTEFTGSHVQSEIRQGVETGMAEERAAMATERAGFEEQLQSKDDEITRLMGDLAGKAILGAKEAFKAKHNGREPGPQDPVPPVEEWLKYFDPTKPPLSPASSLRPSGPATDRIRPGNRASSDPLAPLWESPQSDEIGFEAGLRSYLNPRRRR